MTEHVIESYRANDNDITSWCVLSDEEIEEVEAWEALSAEIFVEFDSCVAQHYGYSHCAIYHEMN